MTTKIIIVGPAPHWSNPLPNLMIRQLQLGQYPLRLNDGRGLEVSQIEAKLADVAHRNGVGYFSVTDLLCDGSSCLTQIGDAIPDLTSFDIGHITPPVAKFLARHMLPILVDAK